MNVFKLKLLMASLVLLVGQGALHAQAPDLVTGEYFIDVDPGHGAGTPIEVEAGAEVESGFSISTEGLSPGVHFFYVRYRNADGLWGTAVGRQFFLNEEVEVPEVGPVTRVEYFFGADPGIGRARQVPVPAADPLDLSMRVPTARLEAGQQQITVRARRADGTWGMGRLATFQVSEAAGTEPVLSNPIPNQILVKGDGPLSLDLEADPVVFTAPEGVALSYAVSNSNPPVATVDLSGSTLSITPGEVGATRVVVSVEDGQGGTVSAAFLVRVEPTNHPPVVVERIPALSLTALKEVFSRDLLADPAVFADRDGDALSFIAMSSDEAVVQVEVVGSSLNVRPVDRGRARITVTADDGQGGTTSTEFLVRSTRLPPVVGPDVVAGEYFIDVDPGHGSGTPIEVDPNGWVLSHFSVPTGSLSPGVHFFYVRYRNADGLWGMAIGRQFALNEEVEMARQAPLASLEYFFDEDPGFGNGVVVPVARERGLDLRLRLPVVGFEQGSHAVAVRARDANGVWGMTRSANFVVSEAGPQEAPALSVSIPDLVLKERGPAFERDLEADRVFAIPASLEPSYEASASNPQATLVGVEDNTLRVAPGEPGRSRVTLSVGDGLTGTVSTSFLVEVLPNHVPEVARAISEVRLVLDGEPFTLDLDATPAVFADVDEDDLSFVATSSDPAVVGVEVVRSTLRVTLLQEGGATITLEADDGRGGVVSTAFEVATRPPFTPGDVNEDERITLVDALFTLQASLGKRQLEPIPTLAADVNGDGRITLVDALFILQASLGKRDLSTKPVAVAAGGAGRPVVLQGFFEEEDKEVHLVLSVSELGAGALDLRLRFDPEQLTYAGFEAAAAEAPALIEVQTEQPGQLRLVRLGTAGADVAVLGRLIFAPREAEAAVEVEAFEYLDLNGMASPTDVSRFEGRLVRLPTAFALHPNRPNPFNPETVIHYDLAPVAGIETLAVRLVIYNVAGQVVRTLVEEAQQPGRYAVRWDGRDERGVETGSGVYLYRLQAGAQVQVRRMLLLQ